MPRNKSEKTPGHEEIVAYGRALRADLEQQGSASPDTRSLWHDIPIDAQTHLINEASESMGNPLDMHPRALRAHYATYIEKHYGA